MCITACLNWIAGSKQDCVSLANSVKFNTEFYFRMPELSNWEAEGRARVNV